MTGQKQRNFLRSTTSPPGVSSNSIGSPASSSGGVGGSAGSPELRRTTSALVRFTRSVSKLGTRRRRGGSELPTPVLDEEHELETNEARVHLHNKLSYETPIRRAETVPTRGAAGYHTDGHGVDANTIDVAAFLKAVPDLLGIDASLSNVGAALRSSEKLAKTLRASAADIDTTTSTASRTATAKQMAMMNAGITAPSVSATRTTESSDPFKMFGANRQWERVHDAFEAALAEYRFEDAFSYWQELNTLAHSNTPSTISNSTGTAEGERAWILEIKCSECAALLASPLQHQAAALLSTLGGGTAANGLELQKVVVLLCQLAGLPSALGTILDASRERIRGHLESLPLGYQRAAAAAEEATLDLAAALGQALVTGIATTAASLKLISNDINGQSNSDSSITVYGTLSDWVVAEVAFGCEVLRKSVVLPRAAPAGLATTTRCAAAFLAHCDELDTVVSIPTGQLARESVWSAVEPVLQRRARQLSEGLRKAAAIEAKAASNATSKLRNIGNTNLSWEELVSVFPSAKRLATEVFGMAAAVAPIAGPAAVASVRSIVTTAFMAFVESVAGALAAPGTLGQTSSSIVAEIAMEIATRLVEDVLADSASVLSARGWGPAVDAAAMVAALEQMAKTLRMDTVVD
ncbi:hypothetical protein Ndes2437B_g01120 [Nannochloris sp. 'desiccata']|nr:hypothetical protein KSW81_006231 [Chlorella desiccata (nom. nud.)]